MKMPQKELQLLISLSAKHTVFIIILVLKMRKLNSFNKDSWLPDYLDIAATEQEVTVLQDLGNRHADTGQSSPCFEFSAFSPSSCYILYSLYSLF